MIIFREGECNSGAVEQVHCKSTPEIRAKNVIGRAMPLVSQARKISKNAVSP